MIVVGGGVCGLTCAVSLRRAGHDVTVWAARLPPHTTSNVAAAFWFPYAAAPRKRVLRWAKESYAAFVELVSDPETGVSLVDAIDLDRQPRPSPPWWADAVPDVRRARPDELPAGFVDGHAFAAPIIDTRTYLPWLLRQLAASGVTVLERRIADLSEATAAARVVVNCTGLGAAALGPDPELYPIRGQLVHVANPGVSRVSLDESGPDGIAYVVPRGDDCVLGGTAQAHDDDLRARPDDAAEILERCADLDARLRDATRLADVVGLRPGRSTIRLESERRGDATVVHDYGHGGAGVTLSWGCAAEVVAQVEAALARRQPEAI
jgi:D-amino-acid oxidase